METKGLGHSSFEILRKVRELERKGKHIIHLHIGEPDFKTPENIIKAAYKAMEDGFTHYTDPQGILDLRESISKYHKIYRGREISPDRIVVTPGAKMMILYSLQVTVDSGDEVIYTDPGYMSYRSHILITGGKPVPWKLLPENGFRHDPDDLKKLITNKTKALILNFPHNPTGVTIEEQTLREILKIARENNLYVISDEIYSRILFNGKHFSALSIEDMDDHLFLIDGFSKTYAMTGWRIGYGIVPERFVQMVVKLQTNTVSCATSFVQKAAIEAIEGPQESVDSMVKAFERRKNIAVNILREAPEISFVEPGGAFYVFPFVGVDSDKFTHYLLDEFGVAVLPGSYFGDQCKKHIRISFANSEENIEEGVHRIVEALRKFKNR